MERMKGQTRAGLAGLVCFVSLLPAGLAWAHPHVAPVAPTAIENSEASEDKDADAGRVLKVEPSPAVQRLLDAPVLSDVEKTNRRLYHGRWDELDVASLSPQQSVRWRAMRGVVPELADDPSDDERYWAATVRLRRGELQEAAELADDLSVKDISAELPAEAVALLRARIDEAAARYDAAAARLVPLRDRFQRSMDGSVAELTAGADAIVLLARLQGRPAGDYRLALRLLDRAIEQDPLAWEPRLSQARLLADHDNREQAGELIDEILALNPTCVPAWELAADLFLQGRFHRGVAEVVEEVEAFAPDHPAVLELSIRHRLATTALDEARALLDELRSERPFAPITFALDAAWSARSLDLNRADQLLDEFEEQWPGQPLASWTVADTLQASDFYDEAEGYFRRAIAYQPNDARPRVALGLMLMQAGDLPGARDELLLATRLNPFDAAAANTLQLVERMLAWPTIPTEHFVIRYEPGPDAALARDMPAVLETIHADLSTIFGYESDRPVQVDLMPDAETFNVRVAGRTEIGVQGILAVCTGDVIAVSPPRIGAAQTGGYHWANVLRHEYVHVVAYDLGRRQVPRWFNEGVAKWAEELQRSYEDQVMLARALHADQLIPFDELAEAFGTERIYLAYLQSAWMVDYLVSRWGSHAIRVMMEAYGSAGDDNAALLAATGMTPAEFTSAFEAWARRQTQAWGLDPDQGADRLRKRAEQLIRESGNDAESALTRYAVARPTDPWPQRQLAAIALRRGDARAARGVLEWLDRNDLSDPKWALELANLEREAGRFGAAYAAVQRALYREPYNGQLRELAATVALQDGDYKAALHQLRALAELEPEELRHQERLQALTNLVNQSHPDQAD